MLFHWQIRLYRCKEEEQTHIGSWSSNLHSERFQRLCSEQVDMWRMFATFSTLSHCVDALLAALNQFLQNHFHKSTNISFYRNSFKDRNKHNNLSCILYIEMHIVNIKVEYQSISSAAERKSCCYVLTIVNQGWQVMQIKHPRSLRIRHCGSWRYQSKRRGSYKM